MERIDKINKIKMHFFVAVCGLISLIGIIAFLIWVFVFREYVLSIVVDKTAFIRDFSNPFEYVVPLSVLVAIFCPYYYILFKSKKISVNRESQTLCVDGSYYPINMARVSDEYVYFGLNFSFLTIDNRGREGRWFFISKEGVNKIPFGIHKRRCHKI